MRKPISITALCLCGFLRAQTPVNTLRIIPTPSHSAVGTVLFYDKSQNYYSGLSGADTIGANVIFRLPSADGSPGQALRTDGRGNLSFTTLGLAVPTTISGASDSPGLTVTQRGTGYAAAFTGSIVIPAVSQTGIILGHDAPANSVGVLGSVYAHWALVADPAGGVSMGGALAMAAAPISESQSYLISNWYYGSFRNLPADDRFARDGGSCLLGFGINSRTDISPGQLKIMCAPPGSAGDHIVWQEKLSIYPDKPVEFTVPANLPAIFMNSGCCNALPGITPLSAALDPNLPNTLVLSGAANSIGSQIGTVMNGNSYDTYIQSRNFGARNTAYNLLLQPLGGFVGIGTRSPAAVLDVAGNIRSESVRSGTGTFNDVIVTAMPTGCAGKPAGTLWNSSGTVRVC